MKVAINPYPHWRLMDFLRIISGPKLAHFDERGYGIGVEMLYIELTIQNPEGTNRDFSSYRSEMAWAQFSILMPSEIEDLNDEKAFSSIIDRLLDGLSKGIKRRKIPDFDSSAFLADLGDFLTSKSKK